jgi:hypothetical protein
MKNFNAKAQRHEVSEEKIMKDFFRRYLFPFVPLRLCVEFLLLNPALTLVVAIPAVTVLAGLAMLAVATMHPEHELPEQYHWEGMKLERDFAHAERAAALGVRATLDASGVAGACSLTLSTAGAAPRTLALTLTHATLPEHDRRMELRRVHAAAAEAAAAAIGGTGAGAVQALYSASCMPAPEGHWRLTLTDTEGRWSIRQSVRGSLSSVHIDARPRQLAEID